MVRGRFSARAERETKNLDMEYYHNLVTEKSFTLLQELRRDYQFILIGGWAVFLWTRRLKSKDIDLAVDFLELEKMRARFSASKNDRLKKYEIKIEEIDIDIYVAHYSNPGLPAEALSPYAVSKEGFTVPRPEILLILKQAAFRERQGSPKGEKDRLDILALLTLPEMDWQFYRQVLREYQQDELGEQLRNLVGATVEAKELGLNQHQFSRLKKAVLAKIGDVN